VIARLAIATGVAAAVLAAPLGLVPLLASDGSGIGTVAGCSVTGGDFVDGLDAEQSRNAATIVAVGQQLDVPRYGLQIALATAMQESSLRNLDYGDRDSLGLFQQRPSTGWGNPSQVTDPMYAARAFYGGPTGPNRGEPPGLLDIHGWRTMALTDAAQAVQRSAYPDAYARWEAPAAAWLAELGNSSSDVCADTEWIVPIRGDYTITARFGQHGFHWTTTHTGIDLAAPYGREVLAASAGHVTSAGWDGSYGLKIEITHPDGTRTWYAHLSRITVYDGAFVAAGETIGLVGSTGNSTGQHLHYEIRPAPRFRPVDPAAWMELRDARL
jgi:murein DD-endopeptidase MepM/ murein hydrolase activator NlpD